MRNGSGSRTLPIGTVKYGMIDLCGAGARCTKTMTRMPAVMPSRTVASRRFRRERLGAGDGDAVVDSEGGWESFTGNLAAITPERDGGDYSKLAKHRARQAGVDVGAPAGPYN